MSTNTNYHRPVLLFESVEALVQNPEGTYVDLTFGGGGHSLEILSRLGKKGRLFSFDQDQDAKKNAQNISDPRFTFVQANFRYVKKFLRVYGISSVDGIMADLGISSYQIDTDSRGFSTRFDADLDMRMNQTASFSAKELVNTYTEEQLAAVLFFFGEVKNSQKIAATIARARVAREIQSTMELIELIKPFAPRGKEFRFYAQVFQALRIEVNDEMKALEEMLLQSSELIKPDGRLVILTYHSLEDKPVKSFLAKGKFEGELEKDVFGNDLKPFRALSKQVPSEEEIAVNNRARSAKLRVGERLPQR